ncbi:MAG: amidohydrolase family protein [Acidobacteriota bacterium]
MKPGASQDELSRAKRRSGVVPGWEIFTLPLLLVILFSNSSLSIQAQTSAVTASGQLVLVGGTIYTNPTDPPIHNGVIVIRDGKIAAVGRRNAVTIPRGVPTLNCSGLTITAGFWNSHVHFFERKWTDAGNIPAAELTGQIQTMLTRYGFTSVFDLGSPLENTRRIRDRIESGEVKGPRIRATGEALVGKSSSLPSETILRILGVMTPTVAEATNATEAQAVCNKLFERDRDGLKIFATDTSPPFSVLPVEVIRVAVEEAHRRHKPVFVHPTNRDGILAAARGGVDFIAHTTPPSGVWDKEVLDTLRDAQVALIPTLKIWIYHLRHDRASLTKARAEVITGQLRDWLAVGGAVLFGTDVGGMDDYDPTDEYVLMSQAGMSFRQILASMTTVPAAKFGESARLGRIAPGWIADIVVLNHDPSRDVRAFADVRYTIRDGKLIYQAALKY